MNINYVHGLGYDKPQTWMPPLAWLSMLMVGLPVVVYLPTHLALLRIFPKPGSKSGAVAAAEPLTPETDADACLKAPRPSSSGGGSNRGLIGGEGAFEEILERAVEHRHANGAPGGLIARGVVRDQVLPWYSNRSTSELLIPSPSELRGSGSCGLSSQSARSLERARYEIQPLCPSTAACR